MNLIKYLEMKRGEDETMNIHKNNRMKTMQERLMKMVERITRDDDTEKKGNEARETKAKVNVKEYEIIEIEKTYP